MTTHYDEEAQAEQLKAWWKENWTSLLAGLAIGLAAIFGYEQWKDHRHGRAEQASQMYEDMKQALADGQEDEAKRLADELAAKFEASPYAANAALRIAAKAVEKKDLDTALQRLDWAAAHSKDDGLRQLVALRKARVLWEQGKSAEALELLEAEAGTFAPLYAELRGDIKLSTGDRAGAAAEYQKALTAASTESASREGLERKLSDLADVVQS